MSTIKLMLPAVLTASIAGPIAASAAETKAPQSPASTGVRVPFLHGFLSGEVGGQTKLTSLARANEWINSPPLTASALRGKVVLVQVWTYTCINWLRTLPYVRAWAEKYRDQGLMVIGVHAPEFSFEKNIDNVRRAAKALRVDYPIAIDNDYAIWRAFKNQYWPALYFVDAQGRVRHHHFGEGAYQQSEMIIRALLAEAGGGTGAIDREPVSVDPQGVEAAANWSSLRSPENYVGYGRTQGFASPGGVVRDTPRLYRLPARSFKAGVAIEELAEDIARRSLLQSLTVRPILDEFGAETSMYEVPAGGRRFRALELLVKKKRLVRTAPIPCIVRTDGLPEEDSLAENEQRAPLHPLDQFRAFLALREKGKPEEEIAAAFFVSANVVRQRLRLIGSAATSPTAPRSTGSSPIGA